MSRLLKNNKAISTNMARMVFVAVIVVCAALYYMSLPKPPPADFKLAGSFGFDVETADPQGPLKKELRIQSVGGFNSQVTLSLGPLPSGLTATFSSTTVTPPRDGVATVTISWSASAGATEGTYNIELRTVSGSIQHTETLTVRIVNWVTP